MQNSNKHQQAQRSAALNKSCCSVKVSKKQQIEERKNDIKRKLLEQMQTDLRNHPEGQAKTYETMDNAKKLKKMLVNSVYLNKDPVFGFIHNQTQDINNTNSQNYIPNRNSNQLSESEQKDVKIQKTQQQQNINNKQNVKQRSQSIQKEYNNIQHQQSHYNHLICFPNQTQNNSCNTSFIQQNSKDNTQYQEQQDSNERVIQNPKLKVKFKDQSSQQNKCQDSQHNILCSHQQNRTDQVQKIKCNNVNLSNFISSNKILEKQDNIQNTEIQQNLQKQDNFHRNDSDQNMKFNPNSNIDQDENNYNQITSENPQNIRNSPPHHQICSNSIQKKPRSNSANTSFQKQQYSNLIENEQDKQELFKKIQDQKDQIAEINKQCIGSSTQSSKICHDQTILSKKSPQTLNQQHIQQQNNIFNQMQLNTPQTKNSNRDQSNQHNKDTVLKQRSVSTYQQSNTSTSKGHFHLRSSSKDQYDGSSQKEINRNEGKYYRELNKSFDENIMQKEQKINDMYKIIERMKVENSQKLSRLEIKKLEEQLEKDKLCEKQMLDLKVQQKAILILQQEKDLLQEESDSYENKYKSLLSKSKHFEKIRLGLEDDMQRQILVTHEVKNQIEQFKALNNDLNKRLNTLKKQYGELEEEKSKINVQKQKIENEASQKMVSYKSINQTNLDLTIEFERKNKENQYQISQLIQRVNDITKKYSESQKNYTIYEKKFKVEQQQKEQLRVELKLIQAEVQENKELKKKVKYQENKLEELDLVVDDLKRKIRNNLNIDMKSHTQNREFIEKIIEKPIFIEKKVEIERNSYNSEFAKQYKEQMIKCQEDFSLMKRQLMNEQELHHQKILECETWRNHSHQIEDKLRIEINLLRQNFDIERSMFDKELNLKEHYIRELQTKINILMAEVENLTHKNLDKNRQIANEIIHSNSIIHINDQYNQMQNYYTTSQNLNNISQISYIQ